MFPKALRLRVLSSISNWLIVTINPNSIDIRRLGHINYTGILIVNFNFHVQIFLSLNLTGCSVAFFNILRKLEINSEYLHFIVQFELWFIAGLNSKLLGSAFYLSQVQISTICIKIDCLFKCKTRLAWDPLLISYFYIKKIHKINCEAIPSCAFFLLSSFGPVFFHCFGWWSKSFWL